MRLTEATLARTVIAVGVALMLLGLLLGPSKAASADLVQIAARYEGARAGQLGLRRTLWCADFMNLVLRRAGRRTTGSSLARSFVRYGRRLPAPRYGSIAVFARGRAGGHVGIVTGVGPRGVQVISGNHGGRVASGVYPRSRVLAFVAP